MENVTKQWDKKLITTEARNNSWYRTKLSKKISKDLLAKERTQIPMNKPVYLGLSILQNSKYWYDYVKTK